MSRHKNFAVNFWPIYKRLNTLIERLVQQGLVEYFDKRMKRILKMKISVVADRNQLNLVSVTLKDMYFILFLVVTGWFLSFIIFICEIFLNKLLKRN